LKNNWHAEAYLKNSDLSIVPTEGSLQMIVVKITCIVAN